MPPSVETSCWADASSRDAIPDGCAGCAGGDSGAGPRSGRKAEVAVGKRLNCPGRGAGISATVLLRRCRAFRLVLDRLPPRGILSVRALVVHAVALLRLVGEQECQT